MVDPFGGLTDTVVMVFAMFKTLSMLISMPYNGNSLCNSLYSL